MGTSYPKSPFYYGVVVVVIVDKQNSFAIQINLFMGLGRLMDVQIVIEYFASYEFIMGKIKFTFFQK